MIRRDRPAATGAEDSHVIAMSRLQARTLTREEFLGAVTGNAASAEGADEVISARLQAG